MLAGVFGKTADRLLKIAKGIDPAPVLPSQQAARLSFTKILDRDEIDLERLESVLFEQVEEAGWSLRRHNRCPGNSGWKSGMRRHIGGNPQADFPRIGSSRPVSFPVDTSRFLSAFPGRVAVRRIVLEFSDLAMPFSQLALFPWEKQTSSKDLNLQKVLDSIRMKFGKGIIAWAKGSSSYR